MFPTLSMVLIVDHDRYSNASLSLALRKMGLARNVVCTDSSADAVAYLHKQKIHNYPFPEVIMINPPSDDGNCEDFFDAFRHHFANHYKCSFIILNDKGYDGSVNLGQGKQSVTFLNKPIAGEELRQVFWRRVRKNVAV